MVSFVKVIAVQGEVVQVGQHGNQNLASGISKLSVNTKLLFSENSAIIVQLSNGRIVKISAKDLQANELVLNSTQFEQLTAPPSSDLNKLLGFTDQYQNLSDTIQEEVIRLEDGRVFQRVGKDYVEVAADTFGGDNGGGNRFVQLSRVGQDVVADGVSPLNLTRVSSLESIQNISGEQKRLITTPLRTSPIFSDIQDDFNLPPEAVDDSYITRLNTPIQLNPLNQDFDADGKIVILESINGYPYIPNTEITVPNGTLKIDSDGKIIFIPEFGFTGKIEFDYVIKDSQGKKDTAKQIITIEPIDTNSQTVVSEEGLLNGIPDSNGTEDQTNLSVNLDKVFVGNVEAYRDLKYQITNIPNENITSNKTSITWILESGSNTVIGQINNTPIIKIEMNENNGEYKVSLLGPIDHSNTDIEDVIKFNLPYQVVDTLGNSTQGVITISIEDDSPIAVDDTAQIKEDTATVVGNVLSNDKPGADGHAEVTEIKGEPLVEGKITVEGKYGNLTIHTDGSYTYTLDNSKPEVQALKQGELVKEEFNYSMRDADNDRSNAKLTIEIIGQNDVPVIKVDAKAVVSEEGLVGANPDTDGDTDTTDSKTFTGNINATDVDHDAELTYELTGVPNEQLTSNGQEVTWSLDTKSNTLTGKLANGTPIIDLVLDVNSGKYTVTLHGPVDHSNTSKEDTLDFKVPYQVKDEHNTSANGNITVTIEDDSPILVKDGETIVLDEKYLEFGSVTDTIKTMATGTLQVDWGADKGSEKDAQFTQKTKNTLEAWSKNTTQPFEVTISVDGRTLIAKDGDKKLFEVTLKINTKGEVEYQFNLQNAFDHGKAGQFNLLFDSIKIIDADGDSVVGSFDVTVIDDNPDFNNIKKIEVNEDLYVPKDEEPTNTFNTNADATLDNTMINGNPVEEGSASIKTPHGTAVVNTNGTITYTPDDDFSGTDKFTYTTTHDDGRSETYTVEVVVNPISNDLPLLTTSTEVLCTLEDTTLKLGLKAPQIKDKNDQSGVESGDQSERLGEITLILSGAGTAKVPLGKGEPNTGVILVDGQGKPLVSSGQGKYTIVLVNDDGTLLGLHITDPELNSPNINYLTVEQYEAIQAKPGENRHENFEVSVSVTSYEVGVDGRIDKNAIGVGSTLNNLTDDKAGIGATASETIKVTVQAVTDNAALTLDQTKLTGTAEFVKGNAQNTQNGQTKKDYKVVYDQSKLIPEATVTIDEDYGINLKDITNIQFNDLDGSEQRSITIENPADSGGAIRVSHIEGEWADLEPGESVTFDAKGGLDGQTGDENSFKDIKIAGAQNQSQKVSGIKVTINTQDTDSDGAKCGDPIPEKDLTDNTVIINLEVKPVAGDVTLTNVETKEDTAVAFLKDLKVTDKNQQGTVATSTDGEVINSVSFGVPKGWKVTAPAISTGWSVTGNGIDGNYSIIFDDSLTEAQREEILSQFTILPPAHSSKDFNGLTVTVTTTDTSSNGVDTATKDIKLNIKVTPVAERLEQIEGTDGNDSGHWKPKDTDINATDANRDKNTGNGDNTADLTMNSDHQYSYKSDLSDLKFVYDRSIENFDPNVVYPPNDKSFNDFKKDNSFAFEGEAFYINQDNFDLKEGWFNQDGQELPNDETGHKEQTYAKLTGYTGDKSVQVAATYEYSKDNGQTWQAADVINGHVAVPMEYLGSVRVNLPKVYDNGLFAIKVEALTVDTDEDDGSKVDAISGVAWLTNIVVLPTAGEVTLQVNQRVVMNEDTSKELFIRTQSTDPKEKFEINIYSLPEKKSFTA